MLACCDPKGGIGMEGGMPWHVPSELSHFKSYTMGRTIGVGMGTKLPPLPGRKIVRLSRSELPVAGFLEREPEGIVIGGGQIFAACLGLVDTIVLSVLPDEYDCDTFLNLVTLDRLYGCIGFVQWDGFQVFTYHIRRPHG